MIHINSVYLIKISDVHNYFKRSGAIPDEYRNVCFAIISKLKYLVETNGNNVEFINLVNECDKLDIRNYGSGAAELHSLVHLISNEINRS